jgi:RNA polymerase sigma-70 factor (ECF subfamily)
LSDINPAWEEQLIRECRGGKLKAQEMLYKHYYGYVMGICLRYTNNRDEAAEILNDGFLKVFQKIDQYEPGKAFRAWLRRVVVNTAIDHYRRNRKHANQTELKEARQEEHAANPLDQLSAEEILKLVQQLPDIYRLAFNLYEIEGYSHEEISEQLQIPVGTSKSNLSRAKKRLRELLTEKFGTIRYEQV